MAKVNKEIEDAQKEKDTYCQDVQQKTDAEAAEVKKINQSLFDACSFEVHDNSYIPLVWELSN